MRTWTLSVIESEDPDDPYVYTFTSWADLVARMAHFDGLAVTYSITRDWSWT